MAPPAALERAISNLVDNAAKFDSRAGRSTSRSPAGGSSCSTADRGSPPDDVGRVFDRFYRAEDARSRPGSGLGLSIVREVVERAGGTVEAADRPGGGAVVGFRLPVVDREPDHPATPADAAVVDVPLEPATGLRPPTPA